MHEAQQPLDTSIKNDRKWVRRLLPFLVLLLGAVGAKIIVSSRKPPKRKKPVDQGILVEVTPAKLGSRRVLVRSHGTVQPERQLVISPEVAGKVRYVNPGLVVGGLVKKGAVLLRIDPVDYALAAQKAQAQIAQAKRSLAEARSNADVALREWKILGKRAGVKPTDLTLGKPQLQQAKAALAAAKADLKQARVRVGRTVLRAPFDLRVRKENVEKGQYVTPGMQLATVFGTARAEVHVPLKVDDLQWIKVPKLRFGSGGKAEKRGTGSLARVHLKVGGKRFARQGRLERTVGEIDTTGRMTRVVVAIDDPYNLKTPGDSSYRPDFEVGSFVEVTIEGRELSQVITLPAETVRIGSVVWVATGDDKLAIRKVQIARLNEKEALVTSGLQADERVILTPVSKPVAGMKLRIRGEDTPREGVGKKGKVSGKRKKGDKSKPSKPNALAKPAPAKG